MNVPLTLLSLAVAPLIALSSVLMGRRLRTTARAHREIESRIQSHVQQTLTGIGVVQAFTQEQREHDRFRQYTDAALTALRRSTLVSSFAGLSSGIVAKTGAAAVLWFGAHQVLRGELTVGSLFVFLAYLGSLQAQLKAFTGIYTGMQTVGAKVDRVCEVLEPEPEVADRPGAVDPGHTAGHVVFENVTFGYEPGRAVLHDVSLDARPGESVALVGPTGAGKSTLVGLIPRFFDPWQGRVTLDGRDLRDLKLKALRGRVSLVLQEPFLFSMTVAENIAYGSPGATRDEVERAAREANAHDFIGMLPGGYDDLLGERGATLSGGERQRLAIARAFLKDAPVLILDEPTSALDARTEQLILQAIQRLMKGRTTFIIAHRLSTIRRADKIVVVDAGRIVEVGRHEQLVARGGLYARFHALQTGAEALTQGEPGEPGAVGVLPRS
jgi:ATP-binding cassette subfamily B protein/subfamily B ATP-binding cassette protein MsbA